MANIQTRIHLPHICLVILCSQNITFTTRSTECYSLHTHTRTHTSLVCQLQTSIRTQEVSIQSLKHNGDSFDLCHISPQSMGKIQVASICTSVSFPRRGTYPLVTNFCKIYQSWERCRMSFPILTNADFSSESNKMLLSLSLTLQYRVFHKVTCSLLAPLPKFIRYFWWNLYFSFSGRSPDLFKSVDSAFNDKVFHTGVCFSNFVFHSRFVAFIHFES